MTVYEVDAEILGGFTIAEGQTVPGVYKYGNHLTPGLTGVRSYAAFFTSFPAEGLRVCFRGIPALKTS